MPRFCSRCNRPLTTEFHDIVGRTVIFPGSDEHHTARADATQNARVYQCRVKRLRRTDATHPTRYRFSQENEANA